MAQAQSRPIALYYWPTPNGWKISIMLEECGLPYVVHPVNIGQGDQFKAEFLSISPNNRMPAIVDPNGSGGKPISVFESGAILQYLGRKTGKFYPADARKRYMDEVHRLLGVMNKRLANREYLADDYSIADMACWGWVIGASRIYDL